MPAARAYASATWTTAGRAGRAWGSGAPASGAAQTPDPVLLRLVVLRSGAIGPGFCAIFRNNSLARLRASGGRRRRPGERSAGRREPGDCRLLPFSSFETETPGLTLCRAFFDLILQIEIQQYTKAVAVRLLS
jgi:hypothetical protein